jgi:hypothetical protein
MDGGTPQDRRIATRTSSIAPNDEEFRSLHEQAVAAYENRLRGHPEESEWLSSRAERLATTRGEFLRLAGIDIKKVEEQSAETVPGVAVVPPRHVTRRASPWYVPSPRSRATSTQAGVLARRSFAISQANCPITGGRPDPLARPGRGRVTRVGG